MAARSIEVKIVADASSMRRALQGLLLRGVASSIRFALTEARILQKQLDGAPAARELALALTKLEEAEMWLERSAALTEELAASA